jgi:ribonuclease E
VESTSLRILRAAEEQGMSDKISSLTVRVPSSIALYLLNQKRPQLQDIEACCGINVVVDADTAMASTEFQITTAASHTSDKDAADSAVGLEVTLASSHDGGAVDIKGTGNQGDEGKGKRRRRRRARKGERVSPDDVEQNGSEPSDASPAEEAGTTEPDESRELQDGRRRRRRGRRGGRRHAKKRPESEASAEDVLNDQDAGNIAKETEATSEPIGQRPSEVEPVEPAPAIAYDQGSTTQKPEDFRNSQPSQFDDTIVPPSESQVETTPISKFVSDNAKVQTETSLDDDMASPAEVSPEAEQSDDALTLHESSEDEHPAHDDQPRQTRRGGWWQRRVT